MLGGKKRVAAAAAHTQSIQMEFSPRRIPVLLALKPPKIYCSSPFAAAALLNNGPGRADIARAAAPRNSIRLIHFFHYWEIYHAEWPAAAAAAG